MFFTGIPYAISTSLCHVVKVYVQGEAKNETTLVRPTAATVQDKTDFTKMLPEFLRINIRLQFLCSWEHFSEIPFTVLFYPKLSHSLAHPVDVQMDQGQGEATNMEKTGCQQIHRPSLYF